MSAAVANAVKDAIGVRFTELPMTAPRRVRGAGRAERAVVKLFEGVRVLDLCRMLAGPYGSMLLADMGAEVIKIEEPDGGDPMRVMGPPFLPDGDSAYFLAINRNKKSVALDLTKPAGPLGVPRPRRQGRHRVGELPPRHHGAPRPALRAR